MSWESAYSRAINQNKIDNRGQDSQTLCYCGLWMMFGIDVGKEDKSGEDS